MGIACDSLRDCHLGQLMLEKLRQHQDTICQIDAATGEEETYASVASRSIHLARSMRAFGLKPGDVLALGGKNHLDLHIPFYAALYNGLPMVGVDPLFKYDEIRTLFKLTEPKIAFCQVESFETYSKVAADLGLDMKIVTFEHGDCTMAEFIDKYDTEEPEEEFRPKKRVLNLSPVNWISNYFMSVGGPLIGDTKVQSSIPDDYEHFIYIINKYKPSTCLIGPTLVSYLVSRKKDVDFSCFKSVTITGSKIFPALLAKLKALLSKDTLAVEAYGQTETIGSVLGPIPNGPSGSCGRPLPIYAIKLVDPTTGVEIKEPYVTGELWNKGPRFTEYYNDPEETALAFSEDGYFKTGDLLYRDENDNYFYIDRLKTLIKYRNSHILPLEVEELISTHPGVKEVCVVGINDPLVGQKAAACVVRNEEASVTAQDIKDLVLNKLSKNKQLRGGVVFVDQLPLTSSGKLARSKVLQLVSSMRTE
ncbi:jg13714 [Pararge aegeria aegeria]|uniref:Jg13714 protein n=1 Tax=Pararge aegeria aegeria TaxID=348720 RepID=A0A8S4RRT6_9NEOP|nr:jg13714 [Pararge aegeria aegeria]